jgi:hypothetical protein
MIQVPRFLASPDRASGTSSKTIAIVKNMASRLLRHAGKGASDFQ